MADSDISAIWRSDRDVWGVNESYIAGTSEYTRYDISLIGYVTVIHHILEIKFDTEISNNSNKNIENYFKQNRCFANYILFYNVNTFETI